MNGHYEVGEVVLGNWTLIRLIGEGSYGKVYEAQRVDFGVTYRAAIKIITIPQSQSEVKSALAEGMDDVSVTAYFRSFVEDLVQEFVLMSKLKGHSNIVSYEDHAVQEHDDGIGWDIIIRMELLTPLWDHIQKRNLDRGDIISLGIGMCRALEICQKYKIVHRDIKPENIFVSELGDYKLGDFGIARTVEKTTGGLSKKGTYTYMAPEVYKEAPYNATVDIYSLGIVMYRLLNDNRTPFLPAAPAPIKYSDRDKALVQRMSGAEIPAPKNADDRLAKIVLKACAYDARERYDSPTRMRRELEALQQQEQELHQITTPEDVHENDDTGIIEKTTSMFVQHEDSFLKEDFTEAPDRTVSMFGQATAHPQAHGDNGSTKKSKKPLLLAGIGVAAVLIIGTIVVSLILLPNFDVENREPIALETVSATPEQAIASTTDSAALATPSAIAGLLDDANDWESFESDEKLVTSGEYGSFLYKKYTDHITISGYTGLTSSEMVTIPDEIEGLPVVGIADDNYVGKTPVGIFGDCKMKKVELPDTMIHIGDYAFWGCENLTTIEIPESVQYIGVHAFTQTNIRSIDIPASVCDIFPTTFSTWCNIESINVSDENQYYCSVDGVLFNKEMTEIICYPSAKSGTEYYVPDSVTVIGSRAFMQSASLTHIYLPSEITEIPSRAFYECSSLSEINIPDNVVAIGESAFASTAIKNVVLPDGLESIGESAFEGCEALETINLPHNLTAIGSSAFSNCSRLESIEIPATVKTVSEKAFWCCKALEYVELEDGVEAIQQGAFAVRSNELNIWLPASIQSIESDAIGYSGTVNIYYAGSETGWSAIEGAEDYSDHAEVTVAFNELPPE